MTGGTESLGLEAFLAALPEDAAAEARVAATRIDTLERDLGPPGWIERNFMALAAGALVMFAIGAAGLFGVFAWGQSALGLGGVTLLVAAFPALVLGYLLSVRGRTAADHEKMDLNKKHFLPHQGLYFGGPEGGGKVVRVNWKPAEPNLREQAEALYYKATNRR